MYKMYIYEQEISFKGPLDYLGCVSIPTSSIQFHVNDESMTNCWCIGHCKANNMSLAATYYSK